MGTRLGETAGQLSRHLAPGNTVFTNLVLFGYVVLATLIAGAASAGAGLAILAIGLLMMLSLDYVRWRTDEAKFSAPGTGAPTASQPSSRPNGDAEPSRTGFDLAAKLVGGRNAVGARMPRTATGGNSPNGGASSSPRP